jgi:methylenetetrahydrofolate--tRNA-(uracil-5-)-methyltransferase
LFFAGQITGVEGYFESTCMGLLVSRFMDAKIAGRLALDASNVGEFSPPREKALGSLLAAITDPMRAEHFQPTNINFGHMPQIPDAPAPTDGSRPRRLDKATKRAMQISNARTALKAWMAAKGLSTPPAQRVERAAGELQAIIDAQSKAENSVPAGESSAN